MQFKNEQEANAFWDLLKFPPNINYCDWEKLPKTEKERLWKEYKERVGK